MSGFSPEWLALREPADNAARNVVVLDALQKAFAGQDICRICDLGAGTGSSVRALADFLPARQVWQLVDYDAANISAAVEALSDWADTSSRSGDDLLLTWGHRSLTVRFVVRDLSGTGDLLPDPVDLVTASALADLTSAAWLDRLVAALADQNAAILAGLNYDGAITFSPGDVQDEAVQDAFNAHQQTDKGFGPALGPHAGDYLAEKLATSDFRVTQGSSPWELDSGHPQLMQATFGGIAAAVAETGRIPAADMERWQNWRSDHLDSLSIGHLDVFATGG